MERMENSRRGGRTSAPGGSCTHSDELGGFPLLNLLRVPHVNPPCHISV